MIPTSNYIVMKPLIHSHCHLICWVDIKGSHVILCQCTLFNVAPQLRYIALNALNTVQGDQSNVKDDNIGDFKASKAMYD